jgi:hypothetical protein
MSTSATTRTRLQRDDVLTGERLVREQVPPALRLDAQLVDRGAAEDVPGRLDRDDVRAVRERL